MDNGFKEVVMNSVDKSLTTTICLVAIASFSPTIPIRVPQGIGAGLSV